MLCWAMTGHKSQGMTLDLATVDLSGVFEYGQAYVALSRCKDLDSLSILSSSFPSHVIKAHPTAIEFYQSLETQQADEKMDGPPPLSPIPSSKRPRIKMMTTTSNRHKSVNLLLNVVQLYSRLNS